MKCPRCGSTDITTTTIGMVEGSSFRDPNKAKCGACMHTGNAGDWNIIAALKATVSGVTAECAKLAKIVLEKNDAGTH